MRDLSLHLLDLLENSVAAGASTVWIRLSEQPERDELELVVEDDGAGLQVSAAQALDPFYTTKRNKRTGLGLALLRTSAELAGGSLVLDRSPHGGLRVRAVLGLGHIDRLPLGDVASTVSTMACTHPDVVLRCELRTPRGVFAVSTAELAEELDPIALAWRVGEVLRRGQQQVGLKDTTDTPQRAPADTYRAAARNGGSHDE